MTPKQQLLALCNEFAKSQDDFAKQIGTTQGAVAQWMMRDSIPKKWMTIIAQTFPQVSKIWLLTGEGEMLDTEGSQQSVAKNYFRNVAVSNERVKFEEDPSFQKPLEVPNVSAQYFFVAVDTALEPIVHIGDIIGVDEIINPSYYDPSKVYFILTKSGERLIKRIQSIKGDNDNLELFTDNNNYGAMYMPKSEILKIYKVVFVGHTLH